MLEYVILTVILICSLVVANEWAQHGFWGMGKRNSATGQKACIIGLLTLVIGGFLQKYGHVHFVYLTKEMQGQTALVILGIPFLWLILRKTLFMPRGNNSYLSAINATKKLATRYYLPGKMIDDGNLLAQLPETAETLKHFADAIALQKKGALVYAQQRIIDLETVGEFDQNIGIPVPCPWCGFPTRTPIFAGGVSGVCVMCKSQLSARQIDRKLHVEAVNRKSPSLELTISNKKNLATAYEEMALLYRMMNRFDLAEEALNKAREYVDELVGMESNNNVFQNLRSLILFRIAEAYQAQGIKLAEASQFFQESLAIDRDYNNGQDSVLTRSLLERLPQA